MKTIYPDGTTMQQSYDGAGDRLTVTDQAGNVTTYGYDTARRLTSVTDAIKHEAGFKARRWVVERAHSWMNRFRRLLARWDKKPENYLALLHFASGFIAFRAAGLFG